MIISRVTLVSKIEAFVKLSKSLTVERMNAAVRGALSFAKKRTSRQLVWEFARYVAAITKDAYVSRSNAKQFFRIWYTEAISTGRKMDSFRVCWLDFWQAVPKVKYAAGMCLDSMFSKARGEGFERFKNLCEILSKYFDGNPFPIASYEFAKRFGVSRKTIDRWRDKLVQEGVLKLVSKHCHMRAESAVFSYKTADVPQATYPRGVLGQDERSDVPRGLTGSDETQEEFLEKEVMTFENVDNYPSKFSFLADLTAKLREKMGITDRCDQGT